MVYIPLFSLVQLGNPAITNTFVVNQIIRYNGVFAVTKTALKGTFFSVPSLLVIAGCHCTLCCKLQASEIQNFSVNC